MRNIVVTGGGTGIGREIAVAFARGGDHVTAIGRRLDPLHETTAETGGSFIQADLTDVADIEKALVSLPSVVDVLINNAGGNTDFAADSEPGLAGLVRGWERQLWANLLSAVAFTSAVHERIPSGGRVISMGSIAAHQPAGSYGAAKAAIEAWNRQLAADLGPRGITCNVIAPGLIEDTEFFHGHLTAQRRTTLIDRTVTGRAGAPVDIASLATFLASTGAGHISSQTIHVNGGAYSSS